MRNLNTNALAKIREETRVESIILVRVHWNGGAGITYSSREFSNLGFIGKLINISSLDDVINIDASSNSASVSITLDDTDNTLKTLIDTTDIHKTKVTILQLFVDLNVNDAFPLFIGEIASPINWNEGDRTLSFNVITRLDDVEAGFSIEEGGFPYAPASAIGKAWPLIFGTVGGVPALQIIEAPSGILGEGIGVVNEPAWAKELNDLLAQATLAQQHRVDSYGAGVAAARRAAELGWPGFDFDNDGFDDGTGVPIEPGEQAHEQSNNYYAQSEEYALEREKILREYAQRLAEKNEQEAYNKSAFRIITQNIPQNVALQFKLGSLIYTGILNGEIFHTSSVVLPELINGETVFNDLGDTSTNAVAFSYFSKKNNTPSGQKFYWIDAGTEIKLTNFPISFVASLLHISITSVYAYKKGVRFRVPPSYYTITTQTDGPFQATYINFVRPLSSIIEADGSTWDSNNIEFDCVSPVGPNVVDILQYLITTFASSFTVDTTNFNHVRTLLNNYPANFALLTRKNIINLLKEIAYQSRCALWISDNIFFIRYLPEEPVVSDSDMTITEDDIIVNTLAVTTTDSDRIITKYTAEWKALISQKEPYKIIYKYNTIRFGTNEQTYDYYIYNNGSLVEVAAQFWMIRQANNYKILKFKTAINKLKLETLDPVLINIPEAANGSVVGIVQKATYNPNDYTIDFEVWIPVIFGTMTKYIFAYPKNLTSEHIYPLLTDPNIRTGNPFDNKGTVLPNQNMLVMTKTPQLTRIGRPQDGPLVKGRHQPIGDAVDNHTTTPSTNVQVILDSRDVSLQKPSTLQQSNDKSKWDVQPPKTFTSTIGSPASYPGIVSGQDAGHIYFVNVYLKGIAQSPVNMRVRQFIIRSDDIIPSGTPVTVHRMVLDGNIEFFMQATVFADNQA